MTRVCQIVVVCEDSTHFWLARGFLEEAGLDRRVVAERKNPAGPGYRYPKAGRASATRKGGSGYSWVIEQFANEVAALLRYQAGRGVLGILDEDGETASKRERLVAARLRDQKLPHVDPRDGRCLLIPARNIETWLHWLHAQRIGHPLVLDEVTDYKKHRPGNHPRLGPRDCTEAGAYLHRFSPTNLTDLGSPSLLVSGMEKLRTFVKAVRR